MSKLARHTHKCNFIHAFKKVDFPFLDFHETNKCYCIKSTSSTKLHSGDAENVEGGERNLNAHKNVWL